MVETQVAGNSPNVGALERLGSAAIGSLLVTQALRKRGPVSIAGGILGADLIYRGVTGQCSLYRALGVSTSRVNKPGSQMPAEAPEVRRSITIAAPPQQLAEMWSDPNTLSKVVAHFATVTAGSNGITHWRARGPLRQVLEWDSHQIKDGEGQSISWSSLPGGQLPNRGHIDFRPGPDGVGTEVTLHMRFEPPLGRFGNTLARKFHLLPRAIAGQTLRRFKSLVETGEIPSLAMNPSARGNSDLF